MFPRETRALSLTTQLEHQALRYNSVHKIWGCCSLRADASTPISRPSSVPVDFVVAIDISASMRVDSKLATIEYLLEKLDENQTFSLIAFNHDVVTLAELLPCSEQNKASVLELVHGLEASGSTNISEALFVGTRILAKRGEEGQRRVSSLMLFTDGLSNRGLSTHATLQSLDKIQLPTGCVFNTFGFGSDHDSKLLHAIAHKAQGVYYFVEEKEQIASTFGECVAGLLSTRAHHISVTIECHDGSRLVTLATPFHFAEVQPAKKYKVNLELTYRGESKTILFRLSLRKMTQPLNSHKLMTIRVDYTDTLTGRRESLTSTPISVVRPAMPLLERIPLALDQHLNRYKAATAITEGIRVAKQLQFIQAKALLMKMVEEIRASPSGHEPYCQDLISDLNDISRYMGDVQSFESQGIHTAHAYASMYFMERSTGITSRKNPEFIRHVGYGYATEEQEYEAQNAVDRARLYFDTYTHPREIPV